MVRGRAIQRHASFRRSHRKCTPDHEEAAMPALIVRSGPRAGFNYDLLPSRSRVRLGRLGSNQLQILDKKASREHAEILLEEESYVIRDLGSRNGTFVNGVGLEEPHTLKSGDRISIGDFILDYRDETVDEIEDAEEAASVELVEDAEGLADAEDLEILGPADAAKDDEKPDEAEAAEEAEDAEEAGAESDAETDDEVARTVGASEAVPAAEDAVEAGDAVEPEPQGAAAEPDDDGGVEVLGPADLAGDDEDAEEPVEFAAIESIDSAEGLETLGPEDVADEDEA
jgi:pSer/pThr/pTyr-binding forkhead associated (FHA) protein